MPMDEVTITIDPGSTVSGLWHGAPACRACLVLAHGAGAGMAHRSMVALADGLLARGVATLRYQFPSMERGSSRPDRPPIAQAAVRAAVAEAVRRAGDLPVFAGGRSFGGRMTSQAQAAAPLAGVRGLVFFAFPLHPAGAPSDARAVHLAEVAVPMLFVQGTKDALAHMDWLDPVISGLAGRATLLRAEQADHSFHRPVRAGGGDAALLAGLLDAAVAWMIETAG